MKILSERQAERIDGQLTFLTPWKSQSAVSFALAEQGDGTLLTWTMDSSLPFFLFWMKASMQAFLSMDYRRGLAMLKDYAETGSVPSKLEFLGQAAYPGCSYLGVSASCQLSQIGPSTLESAERLNAFLDERQIAPAGAQFSIYHSFSASKGTTRYTVCCPVETPPSDLPYDVHAGALPACKTYAIRHSGTYQHLANAWSAGMMRARSKAFAQNKSIHPFEVYDHMPEREDGTSVTTVHFPAR